MKKAIPFFLNVLFFLHVLLAFLVLFEGHLKIPFWVQPLGRMHPLILHFPVAFIVLLVVLNLFKKQLDPVSFEKINYSLLLLTSFTTVLATLMGLLLSLEGYDSELLTLHKWVGIALCFVIYALVWVYSYGKVFRVLLYTGLLGVLVGGHFGAGLTHGTNFLMEPITAAQEEVVDENTPIYTAYIAPVLKAKCTSCHNPQKHKGDLDLTTIEAITKGGENGEVWLAHNAEESLLLKRAALPLEDEEHMPPEGKPQLTKEEITLIGTWIEHGADDKVTYAQLQESDTLKQLVTDKWLKSFEEKQYTFNFVGGEAIKELNNPYRTVVQKSPTSPAVEVAIFGRSAFQDEYLNELDKIKEQVIYLSLANLPITNEHMKSVGKLQNLEHLVLNFTDIDSEGIGALQGCTQLESLSLSGTGINASVLEHLQKLKGLKEVFVWNTQLNADDIEQLRTKLPHVIINEGYVPDPEEELRLTPPTLVNEGNIISSGDLISLGHKMNGVNIKYTLDGSRPDSTSVAFEKAFPLDLKGKRRQTVKAYAYKEGWLPSNPVSYIFYDRGLVPDAIELVYPGILSSYTGEAEKILTDAVRSNEKVGFSKFWASFNKKPLEAIVDFSVSAPKIKEVVLSCGLHYKQKKSPIEFIAVWASDDKENWQLIKKESFANESNLDRLKEISIQLPKQSYKYLKIVGQPKKDDTLRVNQLFFF
ncbi:c-type cytochrome domain-containing protein [Zobellia galactanivorans]|uniref:c-type cytochrome domain-containing protein n=1 Tax=Zobellia galactanivorans (strain DSM 12802 / CCUG 47099 / CIP 106680 / NCIMB 13871 / Dsij) TaxID=63186 RepID=UPI0026E36FDF|nr:c-type cytochrome domain-containing protein [Zobellia galactanivorans]MDO6807800.1 c-type cytochrome domain-containing protein [Zobellia galactanivorans]